MPHGGAARVGPIDRRQLAKRVCSRLHALLLSRLCLGPDLLSGAAEGGEASSPVGPGQVHSSGLHSNSWAPEALQACSAACGHSGASSAR
eukprot:9369440-Lingulodinium_polyedra.AAC.1